MLVFSFLWNKHGDLYFFISWFQEEQYPKWLRKKIAEIYGYFFGKWNENATAWDVRGPKAHVQIMFPLKDKKNAGYLKTFFPGRRWINNQGKSNSVWYDALHWKIIKLICCILRLPKSHLEITIFISIVPWKQACWPPLFITFLASPCTVTSAYQVSAEIYGGFFY